MHYVDKTGSNNHSLLRKYGNAFKGTRASLKSNTQGKQYSAIATVCTDGVIDVQNV